MKVCCSAVTVAIFASAALVAVAFADRPVPEFNLDLDAAPETRWKDAVRGILEKVPWEESFGPVFADAHQSFILGGCDDSCMSILRDVFRRRYPDQFLELAGIVEVFQQYGHNVSITELCGYQYVYEIGHVRPVPGMEMGCTSVVACDGNGRIFHGRNLDFHALAYKGITAGITWLKGGSTLFRSVSFVGEAVGVATAVRKGKFSFSYNWRFSREPLQDVIECIKDANSAAPFSSFVRSMFESGASFSEAADAIATRRVCGPAYAIVGGLSGPEGAVITRNLTRNLYPNWISSCDATTGNKWYVAQANSDHWLPQPPEDNRLGLANQTLVSLGQSGAASLNGVWKVLSTPGTEVSRGVLNHMTLYSSVMSATTGEIVSAVRDEP